MFVYLGSASGLAATAAWTAESSQANANFGYSVAAAGDINGDGYADVIIGAPLYDNDQADEGRAFVYLGSASGLAAIPAWTAESDQVGANFGCSVSAAGDVNGDGYADVIVGAYSYDNGQAQANAGRAYVYLGSASGLAATPAWTAMGDRALAYFGGSASTAGDVNGDGYADVIVGAYGYDNGQANTGRVYVYLGSALGLAAVPAWTAESDQAGACFGYSVSTAGDVNGDGYADVIVGALIHGNTQTYEGRAYVCLGSASGLAATPAWTADGGQVGANFGCSVSSAGDVNGDGYADVIVGAPGYANPESYEGRAFVYYGGASGWVTVTSPNGGELWAPGSTHTVTWSPLGVTGNVNIYLYETYGFTTTVLATVPVMDGSWSWTIPANQPVGNIYMIRVVSITSGLSDYSDANFTIGTAPAALSVASPNGGEVWTPGSTHAVTWNAASLYGDARIFLYDYTQVGGTYTLLATVPVMSGSWSWTIPAGQAQTAKYQICVSPITDASKADYSNANFRVTAPYVKATSPNGGELWAPGSTHAVTWDSALVTGTCSLILYDTYTWTPYVVATNVPMTQGSYSWTIPAGQAPGGSYKMRVFSNAAGNPNDYSDANFMIGSGSPSITVTSPNGGELWAPGSTQTVSWTSNMISGNVGIYLYDTYSWAPAVVLASSAPIGTGTRTVTIPAGITPGNAYAVRVMSLADITKSDYSDVGFTIGTAPASIAVTSPNGGEVWTRGSAHTITWYQYAITGKVGIYLYDTRLWTSTALAAVPATSGSYSWTIAPGIVPGNRYRIRIISLVAVAMGDYGDADMTISQQHTLTYAAGTNGSITGTSPQTVNNGGSGTVVTAVPDGGYGFVQWSDGVLTAARQDTNVIADLNVTASFAVLVKYYRDNDADGYGPIGDFVWALTLPWGYTTLGGDCDDSNPAVRPGAAEICGNGTDDNCNGEVDEGCQLTLTYLAGANGTISGASPQTVNSGGSGTAVTAVPNGGYGFVQWSDGVLTASRQDTNVVANLSVTASFGVLVKYYRDNDMDGYGPIGDFVWALAPVAPYRATLGGDCDDSNPTVNPGAVEICGNLTDDNCNGEIDEGC